jgi:hypothetical protein
LHTALSFMISLGASCFIIFQNPKYFHTTDQTGKNFYHVTQFHPIIVNHICFRYISCHIDNKKSI